MLKRKELFQLKQWLNHSSRKPLVIRGARQVGKSTLVRQLAEECNRHLVEINFERNPEYQSAFQTNDPTQIVATLEILAGATISPESVLLFFDEIQEVPKALLALRYFYEERPDIAVIAAGSLLEFALEDTKFSMPVGRIEYFHLGPLSFTDFLLAAGEAPLAAYLKNVSLEIIEAGEFPKAIHDKSIVLYQQFCLTGGMPEAVATYVKSRSYREVSRIHSNIISTYRDDFNKYSKGALTRQIQLVFDKAPILVGQKFKYVNVSRDHRAAEIATALQQLCMAKVIHKISHVSSNGVPLAAEVNEKIFKILFLDVGLLCSALGINELDFQKDDLHLVNKGAVAEQFIGQHLLFSGETYQSPQLHYWVREAKSAAAEVDYVMAQGQSIFPVEIKSGATGTLRSLHQFCFEKNRKYALRFNKDTPSLMRDTTATLTGGVVTYSLLSLPLYLVEEARRILADLV